MKISLFGAGYVGLVTGACFAELGNEVLCCDTNASKIETLSQGQVPFYEPGLEDLVKRNSLEKRLLFSASPEEAVKHGDVLFIAVGTPSMADGAADLQYVYAVAKTIGENLERDGVIVVTKSTVPVGTTKKVNDIITEELKKKGKNFKFAAISNPEFLREGKAIEDFMIPDRVVVGMDDQWPREVMGNLYSPLLKKDQPLFFMDTASSELTKYAANTFIAARISLINELAQVAELVGADIEQIRKAVGTDKRVGMMYLYPGVGYGGSCFPKDVRALAHLARQKGHPASMVSSIEDANQYQQELFTQKILDSIAPAKGKKAAIWGLSFKPKTDDVRNAPSQFVIDGLLKAGVSVSAYDPVANEEMKKIYGNKIGLENEMYKCLEGANVLAVVTEWPQFNEPDFEKIKSLLKNPVIVDGRNIYSPLRLGDLGFTYISIGRPKVN